MKAKDARAMMIASKLPFTSIPLSEKEMRCECYCRKCTRGYHCNRVGTKCRPPKSKRFV